MKQIRRLLPVPLLLIAVLAGSAVALAASRHHAHAHHARVLKLSRVRQVSPLLKGAPVNTSLPVVSGSTQQGSTLTTSNGTWTNSPTGFGYQWWRCDTSGNANNCTSLGGSMPNTYTLTAADVGHQMRSYVNACNASGCAHANSAPTATVTAGTPGISSSVFMSGASTGTQVVYGTFQSHNQRAVYVPGVGIFVAWLAYGVPEASETTCPLDPLPADSTNHHGNGCNAEVRVAESTNDGATWTTLLDVDAGGHYPPTLEADSAGNVYAFVNSYGLSYTFAYKFPAGSYATPSVIAKPACGETDKFSSGYDPAGNAGAGVLWYARGDYTAGCGTGGKFGLANINPATNAAVYTDMVKSGLVGGDTVFPHYPQIYTARDGTGLTLYAWNTTDGTAAPSKYLDIHYLVSPDHGATWIGPCGTIGTGSCPSFPIDTTSSSASFELLSSSEYSNPATANNWLSNIYVQDNHLFFSYNDISTGIRTYRRATWNGSTATGDQGPVQLSTNSGYDSGAFFSGNGTASAPIYHTSEEGSDRVVIRRSTDDGATWSTYATSASCGCTGYAVSGSHALGPNGDVLGMFTVATSPFDVWFFHSTFS